MTNHSPGAIAGGPKGPIAPIICDENSDIGFYRSVEEAERDMETIDVLSGEYEAFDSVGTRLSVTAEGVREPVRIRCGPGMTSEPDELARRLRKFATRLGPERVGIARPDAATLHELVGGLARFLLVRTDAPVMLPSSVGGRVTHEVGWFHHGSAELAAWLRDGLGDSWRSRRMSFTSVDEVGGSH